MKKYIRINLRFSSPIGVGSGAPRRHEARPSPIIWPLEMANGFLTAIRRGRLPETKASALIGALDRLQVDIDRGVAPEFLTKATLTVGLAHRVSAYDASYLELAMRRGLPLATQDERLVRAAGTAGIEILQL